MGAIRYSRDARRLLRRLRGAVTRTCEACGHRFSPLEVPCASIYCAKCWAGVARLFDLPQGTVACQLGGACVAGTRSRLDEVQRGLRRAVEAAC